MKIEVSNIKWESDEMEDVVDIETTMIIDFPILLLNNVYTNDIEDIITEFVSDEISNISGFTHNGFGTVKILSV